MYTLHYCSGATRLIVCVLACLRACFLACACVGVCFCVCWCPCHLCVCVLVGENVAAIIAQIYAMLPSLARTILEQMCALTDITEQIFMDSLWTRSSRQQRQRGRWQYFPANEQDTHDHDDDDNNAHSCSDTAQTFFIPYSWQLCATQSDDYVLLWL